MPGGQNNTQRIETLEDRTATTSARIAVLETQYVFLVETMKKGTGATENHTLKITVIEQQLLVLLDVKGALAAITAIEKDLVALKKDVESLAKWKEEIKKERDETSRRFWAFGPNLLGAVVSGIISLLVALLVVWLNKP